MFGKKSKSEFDEMNRVLMCNIKNGSSHFHAAKKLTQIARRLSNRTNYIMRHDLFRGYKTSQSKVDKLMKKGTISKRDKELYNKLPAGISQRAIQMIGQDWKSFSTAKKDWDKNPSKYKKKPKLPSYIKHAKTVNIPCHSFRVEADIVYFAKSCMPPLKLKSGMFPNQKYNPDQSAKIISEIRVVPCGSSFKFELIYDKNKLSAISPDSGHSPLLDKSAFISIDLGVSRFAALSSNQTACKPILINGGAMKRINQWYNKRCAVLRSQGKYKHVKSVAAKRNRKIRDKLHKVSRFIVNHCLTHDIGTVIIGKNKGWKSEVNTGKRNNQNFTNLPHAVFIAMLKYKLREIGIALIEQEESYSSKASYIDNDAIPTYGKDKDTKAVFSGKRTKRGMYRTGNGTLIHADINGSANIARKAGYDGAKLLIAGGRVNRPILIGL